jgi:hypothetical protein
VSGETPQDPMTMSQEAFAQLHEMFTSALGAGFTEWQALRLLGVWLAEQGRQS